MKKCFVTLLMSIILTLSAFTDTFNFIVPIGVDDFEEPSSNLNVLVTSSNTNLISTINISDIGIVEKLGPFNITNGWQNIKLSPQSGIVTFSFSVTPTGTNIDSVIGVTGKSPVTGYPDLAFIVRFSVGGTIDVMNNIAYQSDVSVAYEVGKKYRIDFYIDIPNGLYSVDATSTGGAVIPIATNYKIRLPQVGLSEINNLAFIDTANGSILDEFKITSDSSVGKKITLISNPGKFGSSIIQIKLCDNGYIAERTSLLSITPSINGITNSNGNLTLVGNNNNVIVKWSESPNKFGYKVHRYLTNSVDTSIKSLITTSSTSYVDSSVVNGTTYYYAITWIDTSSLPDMVNALCTTSIIEVRVRAPITLRFFPPNGLSFLSTKTADYEILYKSSILDKSWTLKKEVSGNFGDLILLQDTNGFYLDNIIYVREKE
jgi:hypothetical protein